MSSQTKIKKDKEIIAEYETQVKGMHACLLRIDPRSSDEPHFTWPVARYLHVYIDPIHNLFL